MSLQEARPKTLLDKHLEQEAEAKAAAAENKDEVEKKKALKAKKS